MAKSYRDPISGMRIDKGSPMDILNKAGKARPYKHLTYPTYQPSNYKPYKRPNYNSRPTEIDPLAGTLFILFMGLFLVYYFVLMPAIEWAKQHLIILSVVGVVVLALSIFIGPSFVRGLLASRKEAQLKAQEEKARLFNRVAAEIDDFKPARNELRNEYAYHLSLFHWLKRTFPSAEFEKQMGSSRPDIVIDNIAIELKGPTDHQALQSIADKCMRYAQHFSEGLIVVLFEVRVNHRLYDEWLDNLRRVFPHVKVIRK